MSLPEARMKYIDGVGPRMSYEVPCHVCGLAFVVPVLAHIKNGIGPSNLNHRNRKNLERALANAGWTWKREFKRALCPACQPRSPTVVPFRRTETARERAEALFAPVPPAPLSLPAPDFVAEAIDPEPPEEPVKPTLDLVPVPVRTPTLQDRKRIREALDDRYDDAVGRYRDDWTDQKVAEDLKVPRAWVTEIREFIFGPERNEADEKLRADVARHGEAIAQAEKRIEGLLEEIDRLRRENDALRSRLR